MKMRKIISLGTATLAVPFVLSFAAHAQTSDDANAKKSSLPAKKKKSVETQIGDSTPGADAPTADVSVYPYGGLFDSYQEEFSAEKAKQDADRRSAKARADYENKKAEMEREMSARNRKIFDLKREKEDAESQVDAMEVELKHISDRQAETEKELANISKKSDEILSSADERRKTLNDAKEKLSASIDQMNMMKERAQKNFYKARLETERLQSDIAILEAETQALDAELHNAQAEELKTRASWQATKSAAEYNRSEKLNKQKALAEAKDKLIKAQNELKQAQGELAATERDRNDTDKNVSAEVRKVEEMTSNAVKAKTMAEMEKVKVDSEIEKIKMYGDSVKKSNRETLEAMRNSQYELMESRISLETLKSNLIKDAANGEKMKMQNEQSAQAQRNLASAGANEESGHLGKMWITSKVCPVYARASSKSQKLTEYNTGEKLLAAKFYGTWLKVNAHGYEGFTKSDCGAFGE